MVAAGRSACVSSLRRCPQTFGRFEGGGYPLSRFGKRPKNPSNFLGNSRVFLELLWFGQPRILLGRRCGADGWLFAVRRRSSGGKGVLSEGRGRHAGFRISGRGERPAARGIGRAARKPTSGQPEPADSAVIGVDIAAGVGPGQSAGGAGVDGEEGFHDGLPAAPMSTVAGPF